jgi:ketosteroid isomerase-like protein
MKFDEAFNRSDAAAIAATFTENAIPVAPEGVFSGRQAIEKRYAESVFQQWHSRNHVGKILELITVGNGICSVGEWSSMPEIGTVVPHKPTAAFQQF